MWILNLLIWPFRMFTKWMDYRSQVAIVKGEVAKESIRANVQLSQIKKEMHQINMGWWATRWIVPLIAYPVIAWWWMVWMDTMLVSIQLDIPPPPEPIYSWSGEIILSFFIVRGAEMVASSVIAFSTAGTIADIVSKAFSRK